MLSRFGKSNPLRPRSNALRDANWRPTTNRLTTNDVPQVNDYAATLMINGKRIAVVMPAYNAEKTLGELPDLVDIRVSGSKYHSSFVSVEALQR